MMGGNSSRANGSSSGTLLFHPYSSSSLARRSGLVSVIRKVISRLAIVSRLGKGGVGGVISGWNLSSSEGMLSELRPPNMENRLYRDCLQVPSGSAGVAGDSVSTSDMSNDDDSPSSSSKNESESILKKAFASLWDDDVGKDGDGAPLLSIPVLVLAVFGDEGNP
jgi:hypothetical protein